MVDNYIILDWDDTLLATSFIFKLGLNLDTLEITPEIQISFNKLSNQVLKVLNKVLTTGTVVIITNALNGWIESSSKKLMPNVYNFIINNNIKLISARSEVGQLIPVSHIWKAITFQKYIELTYTHNKNINVISIGDSYNERYALFNLVGNNICLKKSIKLLDIPTIHQLINQLIFIEKAFDKIILLEKELDLIISFNTILDDNLENLDNYELDKIIRNNLYESNYYKLYDDILIDVDSLYI